MTVAQDFPDVNPPVGARPRQEFLLRWLGEQRAEALTPLWQAAERTRREFLGLETPLWAAVKLSNHCDEDCAFCGLRVSQSSLPRYRLSAEEVLAAGRSAAAAGCKVLVLQSGRDEGLSAEWISGLIGRLRQETPNLAIALSLGERSESEVAAWRRAGAEKYFLRFITSNPLLYRFLHGSRCGDPRRRLPLLAALKKLGYQVGSGLLVSFPGQSTEGLAADLEFLRGLDLEAVLIGPYIWPAELAGARPPSREGGANSAAPVQKVLALARLLCPSTDIPVTAGLFAVGGPASRAEALGHGANTLVIDFTPPQAARQYACYPVPERLDEAAWSGGAGGLRRIVEARAEPSGPSNAGGQVRIGVCMGSSCFCRGNNRTVGAIRDLLAAQKTSGRAVLEGHLCEGRCKDGPNVSIDGKMHPQAQTEAILEILRQHLRPKE